MKNIFAPKDFLSTELEAVLKNTKDLDAKKKLIHLWQKDIISGKIFQLSETQLDMRFIHQIFGDVLGYEYQNAQHWQIEIKPKTEQDATRPDATLGYFDTKSQKIVRAVIELKGAQINLDKAQIKDKKGSPVEQAFGYVPKMGGQCNWVIVSNFLEIRLYHANDSSRYEKFELMSLLEEQNLAKFLFLLQKERLFLLNQQSRIEQLLNERRTFEEKVSNEFYRQYEEIRAILFRNLCKANPKQNPENILNATQKLIDRIIFMCFVRDTLPMMNILGNIQKSLALTEGLYEQKDKFWIALKEVFRSFDKGFGQKIPHFNGGLFKQDDLLDANLQVQDFDLMPLIEFVLKYDFQSELNVNLLGHIFEQSLSDIDWLRRSLENGNQSLNLTSQSLHPISKRKQDGIFYTPDFITKYIIRKSVGAYLEERKNELLEKYQAENLEFWKAYQIILQNIKILDPACGSGAFLTQVFEFLYDEWQILLQETEKLQNNGKTKIKKNDMALLTNTQHDDEWKIKKLIVQQNIFGFDINRQSVEITKLALWLLTANRFVSLADLSENIFQTNSLTHPPLKDFDVIVGNPPYVRQELLGESQKKQLEKIFPEVFNGIADLYIYFYAQALQLLKPNGYLGFITPNKWLKTKYGKGLRQTLKPLNILQITDFFELRVFEDASTEPMVITLKNENSDTDFAYFPISKRQLTNGLRDFEEGLQNKITIKKSNLNDLEWTFANDATQNILDKITGKSLSNLKIVSLNEYTNKGIFRGVLTGLNKAFIIDLPTRNALISQDARSAELIKPYIQATDIKKWHLEGKNEWFFINTDFDTEISAKNYPAIYQHLKQFDKELAARQDKGKTPYNLRACAYYEKFTEPKILYIYTAVNHYFYYDTEGFYLNNSAYFISNADLFLSVFLNSRIFEFYKKLKFVAYGNADEGGRNKLDYNKMIEVPVPQLTAAQKKPFEEMALKLQAWSAEQHKTSTSFLKIVQAEFKPEKINQKLSLWHSLTWQTFQEELKKQKANIPTKQKLQWLEIFETEKQKCEDLQSKIKATEQALDQILMDLYGFDAEERLVLKNI